MKKAFLCLAILAGLLIFVSSNGTTGTATVKTITINGISELDGRTSIAVWILPSVPKRINRNRHPRLTAIGWGSITNNTLVVELKESLLYERRFNTWWNDQYWTGTGNYSIALIPIAEAGTNGTRDFTGTGNYEYGIASTKVYTGGDKGKLAIGTTSVELDFVDFSDLYQK